MNSKKILAIIGIIIFAGLMLSIAVYIRGLDSSGLEFERDPYDLEYDAVEAEGFAESYLAEHTLEEEVAQLFIVTSSAEESISFLPGGVIYGEEDFNHPERLQEKLSAKSDTYKASIGVIPFLVADVTIDTSDMSQYSESRLAGVETGKSLKAMGLNMDLAPVVAIEQTENREDRKTSANRDDATIISRMGTAMAEGLSMEGILPVYRNYPGTDLTPFAEAIDDDALCIMASSVSIPELTGEDTQVSMSAYMIDYILRDQLGFDGLIMTDTMDGEAITDAYTAGDAAVAAINAGCDVILRSSDAEGAYQAVLDAVNTGVIPASRIDDAAKHVIKTKWIMENALNAD